MSAVDWVCKKKSPSKVLQNSYPPIRFPVNNCQQVLPSNASLTHAQKLPLAVRLTTAIHRRTFYPIFSEGRGGFCIQAKRPLRRRFGADWCPVRAQSFHATLWSPVCIKINTNTPYDNTFGLPIDSALLFIVLAIWITFQTIKVLSTAIDGMTWMEIKKHGHGCRPIKGKKKMFVIFTNRIDQR